MPGSQVWEPAPTWKCALRCDGDLIFTLYGKVKDQAYSTSFKYFLLRPGLLDDLFQQVDIAGESFPAISSQSIAGYLAASLKRLGDSNIARFMQRADMGRDVAICHAQCVPHLSERELGRGGQERHDG